MSKFWTCGQLNTLTVYLFYIQSPQGEITCKVSRSMPGMCNPYWKILLVPVLELYSSEYENPGEGTSYVGQYGMLGYTWVIFEKFSVLFPRDGYLFSTKFLYFFCKVGIYFEEKFCICQTRWNPFTRDFLYFIPQSCCILHIKFLYIST